MQIEASAWLLLLQKHTHTIWNQKAHETERNQYLNSPDEKTKLMIMFCYETTNPSFIVRNSNY